MTFKTKRLWALLMALAMLVGVMGTALAAEKYSDPVDLKGRIVRPQQPTPPPTGEEGDSQVPGEPVPTPIPDGSTPGEPAPTPGEPTPSEPTPGEPLPTPTPEPTQTPEPSPTPEPAWEIKTEDENGQVNLRSTPGVAEDNIITTIPRGARLTVLEREGDWVKVQYGELVGYVNARFVAEVPAEPEQPEEDEPTEVPFESKYQRGEDGNLILDEQGNPIPTDPEAESMEFERDEEGNLVLDENGEPVAVVEEEEPAPFESKYQRDEDGNLILDENGNPIPLTPVEGEVTYLRDEDGNLVLDENDEPIVVGEEEEEKPERGVQIHADQDPSSLSPGDVLNMWITLTGFEDVGYSIQWMEMPAGGEWADIPDATADSHSVPLTEDNAGYSWMARVTVDE